MKFSKAITVTQYDAYVEKYGPTPTQDPIGEVRIPPDAPIHVREQAEDVIARGAVQRICAERDLEAQQTLSDEIPVVD